MNKLLKTEYGIIEFSWNKTFWLYIIVLPIIFIDFYKFSSLDLAFNIFLLFATVGIGHSVGLHRGIIHKSYKTSKKFRQLSLYLFVLTGLGSPLNWLKQHYFRDYWQNRLDCPRYFQYKHSLLADFWWNLHLTFIPKDIKKYSIPNEDLNDPFVLWLHKTWYIHYIIFSLIVFIFLGLNSMLIATSLRTSTIILGHWYIGYASHKYGYARHKIKDADESGFNDILLGLISFGEGFHNNHHSYPNSAKFSSRWYELDFGWTLAWFLSKLKVIKEVKTQKNNLKHTASEYKTTYWQFPKF
ncbi:fatty acid desaturase [Winogradskyella haliclonae]|uniref:Acyl-CoA desaturase n=1 Tax=Winogradskyella haliclonae TaxID=2048558 RepID=A0ABQ2C0P6_9FLAO|nr:fatty acid desaturase [Winogradskyella haliclonae]GGI58322.1 acyl-CoA desaturase [Winogradskyella haliclonae]